MTGNDLCLGPLVAGLGQDFGHHGREEIDDGEGENEKEKAHREEAENEAAAIEILTFHTRNESQRDLYLLKNGVDGNVQGLPEEVTESLLKEHDRELGDGIRDPAGCQGDGDVCPEEDRPDSGENHLTRHGELGNEEPDSDSGGHRIPAGMPEFPLEHWLDAFLEPGLPFHARASKEAIDLPNNSEISSFESGCHAS